MLLPIRKLGCCAYLLSMCGCVDVWMWRRGDTLMSMCRCVDVSMYACNGFLSLSLRLAALKYYLNHCNLAIFDNFVCMSSAVVAVVRDQVSSVWSTTDLQTRGFIYGRPRLSGANLRIYTLQEHANGGVFIVV